MFTFHHRRRLGLAAAMLAALAVAALAGLAGTAHAGGRLADPPQGRITQPDPALARPVPAPRRFDTLGSAVAAGRLDARVAAAVAGTGHVDATVAFEYGQIVDRVATAGTSRLAKAADLRAAFAAQESIALRQAGGGATMLERYENLPVALVRFRSAGALLRTINAPGVTGVREIERGRVATQESLRLIRQPEATAAGNAGTGTIVAVLDTGVDYVRTPFGCSSAGSPSSCRVVAAYDLGTPDNARDDNGHGTNVAGIVAGVAPGARVISMDVFTGEYWDSTAVNRAIDELVRLKSRGWNIVAMNLSIGTYGIRANSACNTDMNGSFALARQWGILPVVAAGNHPYGKDRNLPYAAGLSSPACAPGAFSVGAVHDSAHASVLNTCEAGSQADMPTSFTQSGAYLSLWAPGSCITAAGITMQGTSQAAPHVAGAVAVLGQAGFGASPYYETGMRSIEQALTSAGPSITDSRSGTTRRRLDLVGAISVLRGGSSGGNDTTAPATSALVDTIEGTLTSTAISVKLSWSATDASGIAAYELWVRTNGGSWVRDANVPAAAREWRYPLAIGSTYEFAVRARDGAGNWSAFQLNGPSTVAVQDDASFGLGGGWQRYSWNDAYRGTSLTSAVRGDWIQHTFTGRAAAVVGPKFATAGRATLFCDGSQATLDASATSLQARAVLGWCRFAARGQHTIKVVLEGTAGRPRFDVDAFVLLR